MANHDSAMDPAANDATRILAAWQKDKVSETV
jgi:hypothetical protein